MNAQMMEGLAGASSNIKLSGTPMRVYRQASVEGDREKMKRALGYAGECTEKAAEYQEKLDEGMTEEAKAQREKTRLEQEAAAEKGGASCRPAEKVETPERPAVLVQISGEGKAALESRTENLADGEPVTYTQSGQAAAALVEPEPVVSISA